MKTSISGFPEFLPKDQIAFDRIVSQIISQFELFGFVPMQTSAVERVSALLKQGNDNEIYGIHRLADKGLKEKDLALRFDLTVPLARFVSENYGELVFPFKRYQIAPVWRGERAQAGRYRQFYQCDIDIIGDSELDLLYDAEILSAMHNTLYKIFQNNFIIKINNRKILSGLIKSFGINDENSVSSIMRIIDKSEKISRDEFISDLENHGVAKNNILILETLIEKQLENQSWFSYLETLSNYPEYIQGISELKELIKCLKDFGIEEKNTKVDPSLARGLTYYTGMICEAKWISNEDLGSIAGGGKYENLASSFCKKQLPGVGISIGISRIIPRMIERGMIDTKEETTANIMVTSKNQNFLKEYINIGTILRKNDVKTEIFLHNKPLSYQMKHASRKGFKFVLIADKEQFDSNKYIMRDLNTGVEKVLSMEEVFSIAKSNPIK